MPVTVQELAPEIKELRCRTGVVSVSVRGAGWRARCGEARLLPSCYRVSV